MQQKKNPTTKPKVSMYDNAKKRFARLVKLKDRKPFIRQTLISELSHLVHLDEDSTVAVALSGGVDSQSLLFAALELDLKPVAYTFAIKGVVSRDLKNARATAKAFGVEHRTVWLEKSAAQYSNYLDWLLNKYGDLATSKTFITVMWPILTLLNRIREDGMQHLVLGHRADDYVVSARNAALMCKTCDLLPEDHVIRTFRYEDPQIKVLRAECARMRIGLHVPYYSPMMLARFVGQEYTYQELRTPREKALVRAEFADYFEKAKTANQQSYQKGDTQIGDYVDSLLLGPLNPGGKYKSATAVAAYWCKKAKESLDSFLEDDKPTSNLMGTGKTLKRKKFV